MAQYFYDNRMICFISYIVYLYVMFGLFVDSFLLLCFVIFLKFFPFVVLIAPLLFLLIRRVIIKFNKYIHFDNFNVIILI